MTTSQTGVAASASSPRSAATRFASFARWRPRDAPPSSNWNVMCVATRPNFPKAAQSSPLFAGASELSARE